MSKLRLSVLITLITVFAAATIAFAGCKIGSSGAQDILDDNGMTAKIVYYANGGRFSNKRTVSDVFYRPDSYPFRIGSKEDSSSLYIENTGYLLEGWDWVELDENGNPVYIDVETGLELKVHVFAEGESADDIPENPKNDNESEDENENDELPYIALDGPDGKIIFKTAEELYAKSSGKPVDFNDLSLKTQADTRWHFCAQWVADVNVEYVLKSDFELSAENEEGETKTFKDGEVLGHGSFGKQSTMTLTNKNPLHPYTAVNATLLAFYTDPSCAEDKQITKVEKPTDGNNVKVYVKYISGSWTVIREAADLPAMFGGFSSALNKYYILKDIDCNGLTVSANGGNFNCTVKGNGKTISNLNVLTKEIEQGNSFSMFGILNSSANISDLNFNKVTVRLETKGAVPVAGLYFANHGIEEGATLKDVVFTDITFVFSDAGGRATIGNIPYKDGEYAHNHFLFAGLASDAEFINKYSVKVNGYTLKRVTDTIEDITETLFSA